MTTATALLQVDRLTKRFGGLVALDRVDLTIWPREIFSLIGPNGAGKTTLFNVVAGIHPSDGGKVLFRDADITWRKAHDITALGIARTFQNIRLVPTMNVLENVMLGTYSRTKSNLADIFFALPRDRAERRQARERAEELLATFGMADRRAFMPTKLPYGDQRRVEIARALASEPALLLLDEPSAGMNPREMSELLDLLLQIRETGKTIFIIEHNMRLVMNISDRVAVLNFGTKIAEGKPAEIQTHPRVIEAYLGSKRN
ncbi:MAG: ABC transporter ATP-binding protein [Chloroflexi bacterium]|nr:ABC transporter ATP-binding protein [Chloroflexota bacterium]MBI4507308.1 ABC transporter ATP-binding protein [Chloroflexota bacterium]